MEVITFFDIVSIVQCKISSYIGVVVGVLPIAKLANSGSDWDSNMQRGIKCYNSAILKN